ncbi:hypothetical protein WR25_20988 [Diploscapter pachys]|uniref:Uncharacterized protein n=1 Tax=Diploscapter pachys TaxID=2018661 RepID=A0A2A2KB60_9BILA|nr:hypothetical protein WR25_20988 [Diploscapter pachys]
MAFQLHQHLLVAAPVAQCARQGSQQQIVDLGVVGRRRLLQQLAGLFHVQVDGKAAGMAVQQDAPGHAIDHQVVDRQQQALDALVITDQ